MRAMPVLHLPESVLGDLRDLKLLLTGMNEKLDVQARAATAQSESLARIEQSQARIEQTLATQGEAIDRLESTQADQTVILNEIKELVGNNVAVSFRMTFTLNPTTKE